MSLHLKYNNIYILEKHDGTIIKEIKELTLKNADRHLKDIREMKESEVSKWLKSDSGACEMRLNSVFHEDAKLYKKCILDVCDLFLVEAGNFTKITEFRDI